MAFDALRLIVGRAVRTDASRAPLAGNSQETAQRLQVGLAGLGAMVLLVGLANVIMNSAEHSQATAVPEAAPTVAATAEPAPAGDPLADAGVVPDLPDEPETADPAPMSNQAGSTAAPVDGAAARP